MKIFGISWMVVCLVGGMINGVVKNDDIYKRDEETEAKYAMVEQVEVEEVEEEYVVEEEEEIVEEEYVVEEEYYFIGDITDEDIRNAYRNIPNFKENFNKIRDEYECYEHIRNYIPRGANAERERHCKDNAYKWLKEEVEKIYVEGEVLNAYKDAVLYDQNEATMLAERILDVIYE